MKVYKALTTLSVMLLVSCAVAQEHAPALTQCQADVAVWDDRDAVLEYTKAETTHVSFDTPNRTEINKLDFEELQMRIIEMVKCTKVDPAQELAYFRVFEFHITIGTDRKTSFLYRHHLMPQFKKEDAAGKR